MDRKEAAAKSASPFDQPVRYKCTYVRDVHCSAMDSPDTSASFFLIMVRSSFFADLRAAISASSITPVIAGDVQYSCHGRHRAVILMLWEIADSNQFDLGTARDRAILSNTSAVFGPSFFRHSS